MIEDDTVSRMLIPRLALALILCALTPAFAQGTAASDLAFEVVSLRGPASDRSAPYSPGTGIDIGITLRNKGSEVLTLRRIALDGTPGLTVIDAATDTLDNDADGQRDEADEAFGPGDDGDDKAAWRFSGDGLPMKPGALLTRSFRVLIGKNALPGTVESLTILAGSTLSTGGVRRSRQAVKDISIPITAPTLTLESSISGDIASLSQSVFTAQAVMPGGIIPDIRLTMTLPRAMQDASIKSYRVGPAIDCDGTPDPRIDDGQAGLSLGQCVIDGEKSERDRSISLSVSTTPKDAPPESTEAEIADWQALSLYLGLWSADTLLGGKVLEKTLYGPRILTTTTLPEGTRYQTGDTVTAQLGITNRGDEPLGAARIRLLNKDSFDCISAEVDGNTGSQLCSNSDITLPAIEAQETLDVSVRLRLRNDALIDAKTGPELDLMAGETGTHPFPIVPVAMALHDGPKLAVSDRNEWKKTDDTLTATVGERGVLRLSGTLPPGRYNGEIRLLARVVDARTGSPVAPANLTLEKPDLVITTADGKKAGKMAAVSTKLGTLWHQQVFAFDLREKADHSDEIRRFDTEITVSLSDDATIEAGYLLEIAAETTAYAGMSASNDSWIELLVREPDLRLKSFALDDDRIIQPEELFGVVSLACNHGDSPAFGTVITLDVPQGVDFLSDEAVTKAFAVPLDAVRSGSLEEIDAAQRSVSGITPEIDKDAIRLSAGQRALVPDQCIGIEVQAPAIPDQTGAETRISALTSLKPYSGHRDDERGRRYPNARTSPLNFQIPVLGFGPSATLQIGHDRDIEHPVELTVPSDLGPFRVTLAPESSTGLEWQIVERRDGQIVSWRNNTRAYLPGSTLGIVMRATVPPGTLPLGWADTSRLKASILTDDGRRFEAGLRLVIRTNSGSARAIATDKRVALDMDCDGELSNERIQDAVFEQGKDARPGDCLIVRIGFENIGQQPVERIVIRDAVSSRTTLLPGSAAVRIAPEPLDTVTTPDEPGNVLEWVFQGLFRPGAVGEVEYRLRLDPLQ